MSKSTEIIFSNMLQDILSEHFDIKTFLDAGVLTNNEGLIVGIDGDEFQLTIVQTKEG